MYVSSKRDITMQKQLGAVGRIIKMKEHMESELSGTF